MFREDRPGEWGVPLPADNLYADAAVFAELRFGLFSAAFFPEPPIYPLEKLGSLLLPGSTPA